MSDGTQPKKSPNELLAELVVSKLQEKGFLVGAKHVEIAGKLASGTATQEDWKQWIDLSQDRKAGGNGDGTA